MISAGKKFWRSLGTAPNQQIQYLRKKWDTEPFHTITMLSDASVPPKCLLRGKSGHRGDRASRPLLTLRRHRDSALEDRAAFDRQIFNTTANGARGTCS